MAGTRATTKVPFFMHDLGQPELDAVAEVFAGAILTTGEWVARFERRFADYLGVRIGWPGSYEITRAFEEIRPRRCFILDSDETGYE